jgi:transposase
VFGVRLPRALTVAFVNQALKASEGIDGLSAAMRGLIAARTAVMSAVAAIDADIRRMTRASAACRRLMTVPGVGQLTALAFVAAIDDPSRIRRSRDVGAYLGLVPRRHQSGEVDYTGGISKCGDRRVRTLLYEAANVMLTRYKGQLKLQDWAFAIAKRSTMCKARVALARRLAISCTRCCGTGPSSHRRKPAQIDETGGRIQLQEERRPREGADDGANSVAWANRWPTTISTEPPCTELTPSSDERARRERRYPKASTPEELPPLTH